MRITNGMMTSRLLYNLMNSMSLLDETQQQLATGKKYTLPEQDPIGNVISMGYRTHITEIDQYVRNIDDGMTWLNSAEDALNHCNDLLQRVRTLTIQGANSHLVQVDRDALAVEIDQVIKGLVDVGNTEFRGEFIFGGHETGKAPFDFALGKESGQSDDVLSFDWEGGYEDRKDVLADRITEIRYTGDNGEMRRQIQKTLYMTVNDPGSSIFSAPAQKITSGTVSVSKSDIPLNDALNFNGALNPSTAGIGTISFGLEGGKLVPVSYDASKHSLEDIRDMINQEKTGVTAEIERYLDSETKSVYYRLNLKSDIPGREIMMTDDDQQSIKKSAAALPGIVTGTSFALSGMAGPPDGIVIINDQEYDLNDYVTVDSFMNAVRNDPESGVKEFYYDGTSFVLEAHPGKDLELEDNGSPGFFSSAAIQTRGNFFEKMSLRNWTYGTQATAVNPAAPLSSIPGVSDGSITVNGKEISINADNDTLNDVCDRINKADVGVKAYVYELPPDSGSGNYTLMLRSQKPGEIQITDRSSGFFKSLGILEPNTGVKTGYPSGLADPRKIQVFEAVINIRDHLLNGDIDSLGNKDLEQLSNAMDMIMEYRAKMGARVNTMETAQSKLGDIKVNTSSLLSKVEDVDIAETIMKLKLQENVYQAALSAGAGVITRSLVDFLG